MTTSSLRRRGALFALALGGLVVGGACSSSGNGESFPPGVGPGGPLEDGGTEGSTTREGGSSNPDAPESELGGCSTDVTPGTRKVVCEGFDVSVTVPNGCPDAGCGLILDLHGALMSGDLHDAHTDLRARGGAKGFVVVQPTAPTRTYSGFTGPQWFNADDEALHRLVLSLVRGLGIDRSRVHATGFSQGGYAVLRQLCKYADTYASVAPGAAGSNDCPLDPKVIASCSFAGNDKPARDVDVLFMFGRKDAIVPKTCAEQAILAMVSGYGLNAPTTLEESATYAHKRSSKSGAGAVSVETLEHDYLTPAAGALTFNKGHCVPGSKASTGSIWDDLACSGTNAFAWGTEVVKFFSAHPRP